MVDDNSLMRRTDARNAWICIAAVAAAILITWPVAEMSYGDDTVYTHVALNMARTGRLIYGGWETAVLALHAFWGALFIRLFGFSFTCVRFSTIPFALGAVGFCYLLVRRVGLQASAAVLVTLLFGLSPLFLPVAASFMTDVPCLFFMFASLYFFTRAAEESAHGRGYGWLALGVATGFLGGTGRQAAWFVPLLVLPYLAWIRRRQVWFAVASLAGWSLVLVAVAGIMSWFNRQPYIIPQPSLFSELKKAARTPLWDVNATARLLLMLLLVCLPAALPLVLRASIDTWRGARARKIIVAVLLLGVVIAVFVHPSLASIPWLASTLNWEGINGSAPLPGRPIVLTRPIRAVIALVVYATSCILAGELTNIRSLVRRALRPFVDPLGSQFALAAMSLVSVVYFAMVVIRETDFDIFDRYLLPILPWAATVLLLWRGTDDRAERLQKRAMPFAWALLGVLASYAILTTGDFWALARARATAARKLEAAGVPRAAIDAGFEYNAWTQLMISGRMNNWRVVNPPGAYRPEMSQTPSVIPVYRLEYATTPETVPSEFGSVGYFSFLPPFHKHVSIDRLLGH
jgi:4-amino-4-deoxy-L-arabinose transferase-like glycosyltransferase